MRFNLDNGASFFPREPERIVWEGGFRFDASEPALRYLASGPIRHHLGLGADEGQVKTALTLIKGRIDKIIRREGSFTVHSQSGLFLLEKD